MKNTGEFDFNLDDEHFTVSYTAHYSKDHYGADADGNRGVLAVYLEDVEIHFVLDSVGNDVLDKMSSENLEIVKGECRRQEGV